MNSLPSIRRWVWCKTIPMKGFKHPQPIIRDYSLLDWVAPLLMKEWELVDCKFQNLAKLEAASQDPRILVLPPMSSPDGIPDAVADGLKDFGVTRGMTMHQLLMKMGAYDPQYLPDR